MKNILKYISLLFLGAAAVSCDFEDMPFDKYDSDFVFSNDKKAEGYVLGVYLGLPFDKSDENGYNRVDGAMLASASDEAMITVPGSSIVFLTDGSLTPQKSNPDGCWENNYKFIRDANIGIVGLEKLPEANHDLKLQLQAELKFLKAFFYFELVKRYGGVRAFGRPERALLVVRRLRGLHRRAVRRIVYGPAGAEQRQFRPRFERRRTRPQGPPAALCRQPAL